VAQSTKPPSSYYSADLRRLCLLPLHAENLKSLLFDLLSHPLPAIRHPLKLTIDAEVSASRSVAPLGSFIRDIRQSTIFLSANRSTPSAIASVPKTTQNSPKRYYFSQFRTHFSHFFQIFRNFSHFFTLFPVPTIVKFYPSYPKPPPNLLPIFKLVLCFSCRLFKNRSALD